MFFKKKDTKVLETSTVANPKYGYSSKAVFATLHKERDGNMESLSRELCRIIALRDIPEHGVKAGDLGGWVQHRDNLSHEGNCWVGGDAKIYGKVNITDDALVTDKAVVSSFCSAFVNISQNAIIRHRATVTNNAHSYLANNTVTISGHALIEKDAQIDGSYLITDHAIISEYAILNKNVIVMDEAKVYGKSEIGINCKISGTSIVFGTTKVQSEVEISGSSIIGNKNSNDNTLILSNSKIISKISGIYMGDFKDNDKMPLRQTPPVREVKEIESEEFKEFKKAKALTSTDNFSNAQKMLQGIEGEIDSYQNDIVKLIKYPTMLDMSSPTTLDMFLALKECKRIDEVNNPQKFIDAVFELEKKHMIAESQAKKIAGSLLTTEQKKRATTAQNLINMAMDNSSAENEKRSAVKQSLKQLEGVIPLSDVTISSLYKNVGLLQIEAGA